MSCLTVRSCLPTDSIGFLPPCSTSELVPIFRSGKSLGTKRMDPNMKELSPYSQQPAVLLEPEDSGSNWRRVEMSADAPNLRDYWQVARKHRWKILACFVFAVVMSAFITFSTAPIYTARATLLIERKEPQVVNIQQVISES